MENGSVILLCLGLAALSVVLLILLLVMVQSQRVAFAKLLALASTQATTGAGIELLEKRLREDTETLRRQLIELDQGLRKEISTGTKESLESAFTKVQEGAKTQSEELARFGTTLGDAVTALSDKVTTAIDGLTKLLAEKLADAEKAAANGRANLLRDTSESIVRARESIDASLKTFGEQQVERLGAMDTSINQRGDRVQLSLTEFRTEVTQVLTQLTDRMTGGFEAFSLKLRDEQELLRKLVGEKLEEMRAGNEAKLEQMRKTVDEQLQTALEKSIGESFTRVAEQFAQVQQAIGQVQAVTTQIGDIKRLFSNVKARGGWGEAQIGQLLDDILPRGAYETNVKLSDGPEMVEFAVRVPNNGSRDGTVWLAIDAKFPTEDYDRLVLAAEAGDRDGETEARKSLERAIKEQARRIAKYICPPKTMDYAVMYLPTEGLFHAVDRTPGLVEAVRREHSVYIMSPSLLPALLQMIRVGHLTLALERKAGLIGETLGAVKHEWEKLSGVMDTMAKRAQSLTSSIDATRIRTRAVGRALRNVDVVTFERAETLLAVEVEQTLIDGPEEAPEEEATAI